MSTILVLFNLFGHIVLNRRKSCNTAKNIIFMVSDGMGLAYVTGARIFKNGPGGAPLSFETLEQIGYQRTYSAKSTITDSAAAASAWASGEKFVNGEISCHATSSYGCDNQVPTILEIAKDQGKATGLVAASTITHATPSAFASHVHSRKCETEIARQYIMETGVDVIFGGGIGPDSSSKCNTPSPLTKEQIIEKAQSMKGYTYVQSKSEMENAVNGGDTKILGLFTPAGKTIEYFRIDAHQTYPSKEPTLAEMTAAALDALEEDKDGMMLVIEGSQIDWAGHVNDLKYLIAETLGYDKAVQVVLNWINAKPERKDTTLLISVADHETGGFAVNGPYGSLSKKGDIIEPAWTSSGHTGVDTIVYSQGPGSTYLGKAFDNTDIYHVMKRTIIAGQTH